MDIDAWLWGDWHSEVAGIGDKSTERLAGLAVVAPLRRRRSLAAEEFYVPAWPDRPWPR